MMNRLVALLAPGVFGMSCMAWGCGEPFAYVGGGGQSSAGSSSSGATSGGGESSSASSSSSNSSTSGAGGAPECTPGSVGACGSGKYCSAETSTCELCGDFSRFHFSSPQEVPISTPNSKVRLLFPRVIPDDGSLLFTHADQDMTSNLWRRRIASAPFVSAPAQWGAWSDEPDPINSTADDEAALYLHVGSILAGLVDDKVDIDEPVVLFDSSRGGVGTKKLLAANPGASEASPILLPGGKRDSEIAAAPGASPPRFYWMSDAGGAAAQRLVTATQVTSQTSDVGILYENGCTGGEVEGPWVTPNGKLLMFGASPPTSSCVADPMKRHLYVTRMSDQGKQIAGDNARQIFPEDMTSYDSTPSLTPDACFVLFSRQLNFLDRIMIAVRD